MKNALRFIRRLRRAAVVKVGSDGEESLLRELIDDILDVGDKPPPFLNHNDGRALPRHVAMFDSQTHGWGL